MAGVIKVCALKYNTSINFSNSIKFGRSLPNLIFENITILSKN